ncbi:hypothetical protein PG997_011909 [Apiospora hydei]|uniref:Nephrocystin 3-like N-terminal domain-containing protein n=1 Tax=Apiospora hydei TaxID=1337664 RepID=A0ABR1V1T6_9PEZI
MGPTRKREKFLPCIPWARGKKSDESPEPAPQPQKPPLPTEETKEEEVTIGVAAQHPPSGIWKAVVNDLSKDDRQRLKTYGIIFDGDDLGALDFKDVWTQLILAVEQKQEDVASRSWKIHFRGNTILVRDVIGSIASRLQSVKDIGSVAAEMVPQAALPWAIMSFLIQVRLLLLQNQRGHVFAKANNEDQAAVANQDQSGQLLVAMETATAVVARCQIYEIIFCVEGEARDESFPLGRLRVAIAKAYTAIMSTLLQILRLYSMNTGKRAVYSFFNPGELSTKLGDLSKLKQTAETEAANCERWKSKQFREDHSTRNQTLKDLTEGQLFKIQEISSDSCEMLKAEEQSRILQWVSQIRYLEDHHIAKKGITDNTGNWILQHESFQRWRESEQSETLWLHGIPGAGKTKLSTRVVDAAVSEAVESHGLVAVAYFYCDRNRADHQDPGQVLASLVRQLSFREDTQSMVEFVHDEYRKHQAKGFAADMTFQERTELLGRLTSLYQKVFLVVDGLDECNRTTRRSFMDTLESVRISSTSTVKMFVASRDDGDIKARYEATSNLLISASDNQEDIERFVLAQIDASTWRDNPKMQTVLDEVIETFKAKSQGMFLWASLHIHDLLELQRPTDIRLYLEQLPEGLRRTYDHIFATILAKRGSESRIATRAFQWLMCSWRPLGPEELLVLVCQDSDTDLSFETDITPQYLLEACHNLIVVTTPDKRIQEKETAGWTRLNLPPPSRSFCRFAHLSVQEYFESNHWNMEKCNSLATQTCLHLLATPSFMKSWESWQRIEFDPRKYDQICEELSRPSRPSFTRGYGLLKPVSMAALGCVAIGLVELVEDWIHEGILDVNSTADMDIPLLSIAAEAAQFQMCKLLLEAGADPNCMATYEYKKEGWHPRLVSMSPIDAAAQSYQGSGKRLAITSLLIEHGAQANRSMKGLEYALDGRNNATLKLLLDHGAGTNELSDGLYWPKASRRPELCTELFKHGVKTHEVILKPETFILGFKKAIRREDAYMNAYLWQRSVERAGAPSYDYGPHMFQSIQMENLMRFRCSIDANLRSITDGLTPLERFCYQIYTPTKEYRADDYNRALSLLIDEGGAEINSHGPIYGTPLHICFTPRFGPFGICPGWPDWCVNMFMARKLLERGARVDIRGGRDNMTVVELALQVRNINYMDLVNGVLAAADLPTRAKEDFPDNREEPEPSFLARHMDAYRPHRSPST